MDGDLPPLRKGISKRGRIACERGSVAFVSLFVQITSFYWLSGRAGAMLLMRSRAAPAHVGQGRNSMNDKGKRF